MKIDKNTKESGSDQGQQKGGGTKESSNKKNSAENLSGSKMSKLSIFVFLNILLIFNTA